MSGTSALVAPRQAAESRTRPWMLSPYSLPLHMLRIAGSCALPLIMWFALGRVVRWGLLLLAATVSHGSWYQARLILTVFLFTLVVMTSLATTAGMLHVIRGALMETRARRAAGEGREGIFGALNRTALLFAGIYMTWGFVQQDVTDLMNIDLFRKPDVFFTDAFSGQNSQVMAGLINLDVTISLVAMVLAYVLKTIFGRRHEASEGRFSGIVATFGELAFVFYGLNAVGAAVDTRAGWVGTRTAVAALKEWRTNAEANVPGFAVFSEFLGNVWPYVVEALILPLAWLTVGVLVYGAYVEDTETTIRGTRLETVAARMQQTHTLTRRAAARLTAGWTERWIPLINAFRLTIRGGAPLFGLFALCYVGLHVGSDYLGRAGRYLMASDRPYLWFVTDVPVEFVTDLVTTTLTMCLIAATFDLAATRSRLGR
ncbi:hypothetical protein IMZ11_29055 [Microtetraspora sp. AC03309]|uniref:hypothetical protein n=1 Tax=Microtetraspora sp. AC03309 TaxID=2779376 RepID=UPI001E384F07|nr:hypothetical protein [Microtetraspora sp. AC03309]MCC5579684.1 hypothetical protein [Microtetraspora sp. AC03309]